MSRLGIIEPNKDPVTDNHFVYDTSANGVCTVSATGTSGSVDKDPELVWQLDSPPQGSVLTSDPTDCKGPAIAFHLTGLPAANGEFGPRDVKLSGGGLPWGQEGDAQEVELLFTRTALDHPDPGRGYSPNWYYYWDQTPAAYGNPHPLYSPNPGLGQNGFGATVWNGGAWVTFVGPDAHTNALYGPEEGIDCYAVVCRHEEQHRADFTIWWPTGYQPGNPDDPDGDWVPTWVELQYSPVLDPNNAYSHGQQNPPDGEFLCEARRAHWAAGSADAVDWAAPGHQSDR